MCRGRALFEESLLIPIWVTCPKGIPDGIPGLNISIPAICECRQRPSTCSPLSFTPAEAGVNPVYSEAAEWQQAPPSVESQPQTLLCLPFWGGLSG